MNKVDGRGRERGKEKTMETQRERGSQGNIKSHKEEGGRVGERRGVMMRGGSLKVCQCLRNVLLNVGSVSQICVGFFIHKRHRRALSHKPPHAPTRAHTHAHTHARTHTHTHARRHTHTHTHTHTYTHIHTHLSQFKRLTYILSEPSSLFHLEFPVQAEAGPGRFDAPSVRVEAYGA